MPLSLRAARALLTKKGREAGGSFLIEGPTLLEEAVQSGVEIEALFATPQASERYPLVHSFDDGRLTLAGEAALARLSAVERPTGLIAVARKRTVSLESVLTHERLLLLAGLSDPGNVGTLLRSAYAFGVEGVLLLEESVELHNPKIVRAAMGAVFRLDCALLPRAEAADALRDRPIIGADMEGVTLDTFHFPPAGVVVIGHERHGLREAPIQPTTLVGIPQHAATESLNAAIAGSIILYAWSRQRRLSSLG
jgi:TrmH family RNA methyltransferase